MAMLCFWQVDIFMGEIKETHFPIFLVFVMITQKQMWWIFRRNDRYRHAATMHTEHTNTSTLNTTHITTVTTLYRFSDFWPNGALIDAIPIWAVAVLEASLGGGDDSDDP